MKGQGKYDDRLVPYLQIRDVGNFEDNFSLGRSVIGDMVEGVGRRGEKQSTTFE